MRSRYRALAPWRQSGTPEQSALTMGAECRSGYRLGIHLPEPLLQIAEKVRGRQGDRLQGMGAYEVAVSDTIGVGSRGSRRTSQSNTAPDTSSGVPVLSVTLTRNRPVSPR